MRIADYLPHHYRLSDRVGGMLTKGGIGRGFDVATEVHLAAGDRDVASEPIRRFHDMLARAFKLPSQIVRSPTDDSRAVRLHSATLLPLASRHDAPPRRPIYSALLGPRTYIGFAMSVYERPRRHSRKRSIFVEISQLASM